MISDYDMRIFRLRYKDVIYLNLVLVSEITKPANPRVFMKQCVRGKEGKKKTQNEKRHERLAHDLVRVCSGS